MPVDSKSVFFKEKSDEWRLAKDVLEGESAIKSAGELYLPKLKGQTQGTYDAYKGRGSFFNASARTVQGLSGAVMRKPVTVEVPKAMESWLKKVTQDGLSFKDVVKLTVNSLISLGYFGIMVDINSGDAAAMPFLSLYEPQSIHNFKFAEVMGSLKLVRLVLGEIEYEEDDTDRFEQVEKKQIRVLELVDNKFLEVQVYRRGKDEEWFKRGETLLPNIRGKRLDYIPFQFFGAIANLPIPPKPPLLDLMYQNLQHWRLNVDYFHGLHFCALPTPWAAGFKKEAKLFLGPEKAWISEKPEATCGFLEFSGDGLKAIKEALEDIARHMAVLGARLLEEPKRAVEAADTIRLRSSGDSATLSSIVNSAELGLVGILRIVAEWMKQADSEIAIDINKDFVSEKLSSQDITALLLAVQAGRISMDTFLYNLKVGEILPEDRSVDDEKDLIEAEGFIPFKEEEVDIDAE